MVPMGGFVTDGETIRRTPMSGRSGVIGLRVAKATIEKFVERAARLYEQEREEPDGPSLLGLYVRRWSAWACGGLDTASPGLLALTWTTRRCNSDQPDAE